MPHRIRDGLIDYLEIMRLTGVDMLGPPPGTFEFVEPVPLEADSKADESVPVAEDRAVEDREERTAEEKKEDELVAAKKPTESGASQTEKLRRLAAKVAQCSLCEELAISRTQTVFGTGNPDAELVFLGEAPGADEDKQGVPFVGRAGKLLDDIIVKGMKLRREDVYICNILRCRPPGNRNPSPEEAEHCRPFLDKTLEIIRPKFICCLGAVAAKNLLRTEQTIGSMRGKILTYDASFGPIKVVCTYHPAYLLRNPPAKKQTWDDIKILMREMGLPVD